MRGPSKKRIKNPWGISSLVKVNYMRAEPSPEYLSDVFFFFLLKVFVKKGRKT